MLHIRNFILIVISIFSVSEMAFAMKRISDETTENLQNNTDHKIDLTKKNIAPLVSSLAISNFPTNIWRRILLNNDDNFGKSFALVCKHWLSIYNSFFHRDRNFHQFGRLPLYHSETTTDKQIYDKIQIWQKLSRVIENMDRIDAEIIDDIITRKSHHKYEQGLISFLEMHTAKRLENFENYLATQPEKNDQYQKIAIYKKVISFFLAYSRMIFDIATTPGWVSPLLIQTMASEIGSTLIQEDEPSLNVGNLACMFNKNLNLESSYNSSVSEFSDDSDPDNSDDDTDESEEDPHGLRAILRNEISCARKEKDISWIKEASFHFALIEEDLFSQYQDLFAMDANFAEGCFLSIGTQAFPIENVVNALKKSKEILKGNYSYIVDGIDIFSRLYGLALMTSSAQDKKFQGLFQYILSEFDNDDAKQNEMDNLDKVLMTIAQKTWLHDGIKNNFYICSLKRMTQLFLWQWLKKSGMGEDQIKFYFSRWFLKNSSASENNTTLASVLSRKIN